VQQNVTWSINIQNLADTKAQTFVGTPAIGRVALTRLQWSF
jgi:outer membrane receptor protein involved in Fe transport